MESDPDEEPRETRLLNCGVVAVRVQENYEDTEDNSSANSGTGVLKGKYYKQTYRTAWEQMPDFKGWLRGVHGQPTRAYCIYCQKTLHAHRLSLLKHTCTIRHQKAAQLFGSNKSQVMEQEGTTSEKTPPMQSQQSEEEGESGDVLVQYGQGLTVAVARQKDTDVEQDAELENDEEDEDDEEDITTIEPLPVQFQKQFSQQFVTMSSKPPISTHVLDTAKGQPVTGLQVSLYKLIDGRWTYINEGVTSTDGRYTNFVERTHFTPGRYKLHYDVDRYFESRKMDSLYPFIEIVFDCRATSEHYHIPLLLSPYGYTTYRGS